MPKTKWRKIVEKLIAFKIFDTWLPKESHYGFTLAKKIESHTWKRENQRENIVNGRPMNGLCRYRKWTSKIKAQAINAYSKKKIHCQSAFGLLHSVLFSFLWFFVGWSFWSATIPFLCFTFRQRKCVKRATIIQ